MPDAEKDPETGRGYVPCLDKQAHSRHEYERLYGTGICPGYPVRVCDNYLPPLTCLTAPSTETGCCDKCRARVTAEETLAKVRDLHDAWGDTNEDEIRPMALWESLRRILDGEQ